MLLSLLVSSLKKHMQKTKRIILQCLMKHPADRSKLRMYFSLVGIATNPDTLMSHLSSLLKYDCIKESGGIYSITKGGRELERLLTEVDKLIK